MSPIYGFGLNFWSEEDSATFKIVTNNRSFKNGFKTETLKGLFESDIFFCPSLIHFDSVIESETSL